MYQNYEIIELTKDNKNDYLSKIVDLENDVYNAMKKEGKEGQFFTTGAEDISNYIDSKDNKVIVAVKTNPKNNSKNVIAATYITSSQVPFSYNDITKYFKADEQYQEYIRNQYSKNFKIKDENDKKIKHEKYIKELEKTYKNKILAFRYAREQILDDRRIDCADDILENEVLLKIIEHSSTKFDERNEIRAELNDHMYTYMKSIGCEDEYEKFYWVNSDFIKVNKNNNNKFLYSVKELWNKATKKKQDLGIDVKTSDIKAYDRILELQKYTIYEKPEFDISKYYNANTRNTIEIDTYITSPIDREKGLARILVLEGIKKSLKDQLKNTKNQDIYLVSTLHRENLSSKYVSEFFGLKDSLFVNRRQGRDREVHILGLKRNEVSKYIEDMEKKIAVIYDYNPNKIEISEDEKNEILNQQLKYEIKELGRLQSLGKEEKRIYSKYIKMKYNKIKQLNSHIKDKEKAFRDRIKVDVNKLPKRTKGHKKGVNKEIDGR